MKANNKTSLKSLKTIKDRRTYIEKAIGAPLTSIGSYDRNLDQAQYKNCENMIGATQIPLGVAGPLQIHGEYAQGTYYIPLATTEGALVASISRGCKAISLSGGAIVRSEYVGISRGAVFQTKGIRESIRLKKWLSDHFQDVSVCAISTSTHLKLLKIDTSFFGKNIFVRFSFDTHDAMGMNMVTIATDKVCQLVEKETGMRLISLAGNYDVDKKPSYLNFLLGRGRKVWAEAVILKEIVRDVLKTTPQKVHEVALRKNVYGSIASGSLGFNAHFANVIAALFMATGQDVAHTVEGSLGITTTEIDEGHLYVSVYMPDLVVGTVGGGTGLATQKEALQLLGVAGGAEGKNASKFAEIVVAAVLAGELSLLSSLAQGTLATSHQKFAREIKI